MNLLTFLGRRWQRSQARAATGSTPRYDLATRARRQWEQRSKRWLGDLANRVEARHASAEANLARVKRIQEVSHA